MNKKQKKTLERILIAVAPVSYTHLMPTLPESDSLVIMPPSSLKNRVFSASSRLPLAYSSAPEAMPTNSAVSYTHLIGYGRYSGEIQLVRADLPADEKVNVIGEVPAEYDLLLDCIKRGKTFRMVKVS